MKKKIFKAVLYILAVTVLFSFVFVFIFKEKILISTGNYLIEQNELKKCHAVVPLSGGFPEREIEAADILNEGYSDFLILLNQIDPVGYEILKERKVEFKSPLQMKIDAIKLLGVKEEKIITLKDPVDRTVQEAFSVKNFLKPGVGIKCIIIVTSNYHTKRSGKIFRKVFKDTGINIIIRGLRFDDYSAQNWWKKPRYVRGTVTEFLKLSTGFIY